MKKLILAICSLSIITMRAQCKCETIKRESDKIIQCIPLPVAFDSQTEIGLSISTNGSSKFIAIVIRFKGDATKTKGNIGIRLTDNNMFTLPLVNTQLAYIKDSQVCNAIYLLTEENVKRLMASNLYTISIELSDGLLHSYTVTSNSEVIKTQLNCLK